MKKILFALGVMLALPHAALAQWETVVPGGDTICSDGSPFRFFVYRSDPSKLLIEFEGGGACWNAAT
ncbi:MAG: esterase, partial [Vicinamibacteria bacterium]